jgi:hypothetical protein
VRNSDPLPANATSPLVRYARDFAKAKPISNEVFGPTRLCTPMIGTSNIQSEGVVENTADWTKEKISIDAGYGNECLPLYLFLPKNVHPPFQVVLFYPNARVYFNTSSHDLGDTRALMSAWGTADHPGPTGI